jgi:hypothetical protein
MATFAEVDELCRSLHNNGYERVLERLLGSMDSEVLWNVPEDIIREVKD